MARTIYHSTVYRAVSAEGYRRGPYRATLAEAQADCPDSGSVLEDDADVLLHLRRVPWDLVDQIFSTGQSNRPDGIEQVWRQTSDPKLLSRAAQALRMRRREVPWR
jgi:hypothetical protein